jgi:outer membrane receptor protein involved in Fe transport
MRAFSLCTNFLVALTTVLLTISAAFPQASITGVVEGRLTDAQGNLVLAGQVTLSDPAGGFVAPAQSPSAEGRFRFAGVPPGSFVLTVEAPRFQPYEVRDILVNPGETRRIDISLPESLTEKVTVHAPTLVVDTRDVASQEVVDADYVNRIPLHARRYQQIMTLFPGVSNAGNLETAQYHVNGGRIRDNGYRLDGVTIQDFAYGTFGANISQNSIERFEMQTGWFLPEYGEQSSSVANIVTKSGTNEFEFFYSGFYRSDSFGSDVSNQDQIFDVDLNSSNNHSVRPETQQWQELSAGGPIIQDRLWFFTSFQYWQEDFGSIFNDTIRKGDRFNGQFKLTYQAAPRNTLMMNLVAESADFSNAISDGRYAKDTNFDATQDNWLVQLRDTHIFNASWMLETQLVYHHQEATRFPSQDGLGDFTLTFAPGMATAYSGSYLVDLDRKQDQLRLGAAATTQQGSHTVKVGLDYSYQDYAGTVRLSDLVLDFSPLLQDGTGDPDAQFVFAYDYLTPEVTDRRDSEYAAYAQDTWEPNEHLTVQGGVRLDYQSMIEDLNVAPRIGIAIDPAGNGKSKILANWGRFYDRVFTDIVQIQDADGLEQQLTYVIPTLGVYNYDVPAGKIEYVTDGELEAPYKDSWTVGYEHALPGDLKLGVSTTRWKGKNQIRTSWGDVSTLPGSAGPVNPATTDIVVGDTNGRADYRDYKIYLRKLLSYRFELMGSYTRSRVRGDYPGSLDPYSRGADRNDPEALSFARLDYDRPDVINLSGSVHLPVGFSMTGIYRYQSGLPYSPLVVSSGETRIDPETGRNGARMPPFRSLDLSAAKVFQLSGTDLKITAQVFNLMNELNVNLVDTTKASSSFGSPVAVEQGRIWQFGLEVRF